MINKIIYNLNYYILTRDFPDSGDFLHLFYISNADFQ